MLEHFFIATAYATLIVLFLASGTLFACRKHGDRSRIILACIFLLTVAIYSFKMERFFEGSINAQITSVPMLTLTFFSIISFIIYPIEVISPGWFNKRRLLLFYLPIPIIIGIYFLSVAFGITYTEYTSLKEMLPFAFQFNVLFRLTICLVMFLPLFFVFFIPHTRIYSNADKTWIQIYTSSFAIILLSYLLALTFQDLIIYVVFFHLMIAFTIVLLYLELGYRMIGKTVSKDMILKIDRKEEKSIEQEIKAMANSEKEGNSKIENKLFVRLQKHMAANQAWRDPNISLSMLTETLATNRTSLSQAIRESGADSFSTYINKMRIDDFIALIEEDKGISIKEAFFICGYRSRTTALRNFKLFTGSIPSTYFEKDVGGEW